MLRTILPFGQRPRAGEVWRWSLTARHQRHGDCSSSLHEKTWSFVARCLRLGGNPIAVQQCCDIGALA